MKLLVNNANRSLKFVCCLFEADFSCTKNSRFFDVFPCCSVICEMWAKALALTLDEFHVRLHETRDENKGGFG